MSETKTAPLTDEEVAGLAYVFGRTMGGTGNRQTMADGHRLVQEVHRLRSDAWLEAAVAEIGSALEAASKACDRTPDDFDACSVDLLTILKKHRDGKA